ncbi:MAG: nucleotidyl cyclase domain-containing protein [Planctomycetota bacterium]|jgi:class 3 adenylate cyclase
MTREKDDPIVLTKLVLFFDLCSSTLILEELLRSERLKDWRDLLIALKNFLIEKKEELHFEIYNFIGDGWVLLFDPNCSADVLFSFLQKLCKKYNALYEDKIAGVLASDVGNVGIKFGIEKGSLICMKMVDKTEYIGRALNVAQRLQEAIKDKGKKPQGKVLMTNNVFKDFETDHLRKFQIFDVKRKLRNISGGEDYHAKKLHLFNEPRMKA